MFDHTAIGMVLKGTSLLTPTIAKPLWEIVSDEEYRASAENHRHDYSPWVQGKLRALMARLYVI